jgi:hypothetical protein
MPQDLEMLGKQGSNQKPTLLLVYYLHYRKNQSFKSSIYSSFQKRRVFDAVSVEAPRREKKVCIAVEPKRRFEWMMMEGRENGIHKLVQLL